jgi:hypothetical protein
MLALLVRHVRDILGRLVLNERAYQDSPCPAEIERRRRARTEALAFDVFGNSTKAEEYRPS